jgi:hypothetical protein
MLGQVTNFDSHIVANPLTVTQIPRVSVAKNEDNNPINGVRIIILLHQLLIGCLYKQ